ncbi:zinc ribbon domain-containing protein [Alicyclobacillus fodiniaquatilis]|uniref:Zinc ribbon domain-containing protein n=1 Tax=Alicyclobacillus fodiniaquatilis TaxID=1661150 RepID=A0ABW4JIH4_9BACL
MIADRFYPSSKRCLDCGHKKTDLKLSDRMYRCSECGMTMDRDLNAAINLKQYGMRELSA